MNHSLELISKERSDLPIGHLRRSSGKSITSDSSHNAVLIDDHILDAFYNQQNISGFTHDFYRYPACFSPAFVRAIIEQYTEPGSLILDPFVGGGTTLVESNAAGRDAIGLDLNPLATFVSQAKTTILTDLELSEIGQWSGSLPQRLNLRLPPKRPSKYLGESYQRHVPWQLRKVIEFIDHYVLELESERKELFVRCALLKTAKWALDGRKVLPPVNELKQRFFSNILTMSEEIKLYSTSVWETTKKYDLARQPRSECLTCSAIGLENNPVFRRSSKKPALVLTSPPYPGMHVLYHRWQISGGRETSVPYWLIHSDDGYGEAHFTLGSRKEMGLNTYFSNLLCAFTSIRKVIDENGFLVQLVSFPSPTTQLPKFLDCLVKAGFRECGMTSDSGCNVRIWRDVPNRRWYTNLSENNGGRQEILLVHRPE